MPFPRRIQHYSHVSPISALNNVASKHPTSPTASNPAPNTAPHRAARPRAKQSNTAFSRAHHHTRPWRRHRHHHRRRFLLPFHDPARKSASPLPSRTGPDLPSARGGDTLASRMHPKLEYGTGWKPRLRKSSREPGLLPRRSLTL